MRLRSLVIWLAVLCCGCTVSQPELLRNADRIAAQGGLERIAIETGSFTITAFARLPVPHSPVRFYLEGDGKAWVTRNRVSLNPTPHDPVALRLAAVDPAANVVYIARPCQFVSGPEFAPCTPHDWTDQRYSPRIVAALNETLEHFMAVAHANTMELVGFSGGGTLAVLVAAQRDDVTAIRTVAANLDIEAFTSVHRTSPLSGSLNPSDFAHKIVDIPQRHLIGEHDSVIPPVIAQRFRQHLPHQRCVSIQTLAGATHQHGWVENWPTLVNSPLRCAAIRY